MWDRTPSQALVTRNRAVNAAFKQRENREVALEEMRRLRTAQMLNNKLIMAQERASMIKSASLSSLHEASLARDASIARANAIKVEQEEAKHVKTQAEAAAREQERRVQVARVQVEKQRQQEEIAAHNRGEEMKRQVMLDRVAQKEAEERLRLAAFIHQAEEAGVARKKIIAAKKEQTVVERAVALTRQLQRAQTAKGVLEVMQIQKTKAAASLRAQAREDRVARVQVEKEAERLQYAKRNAEEEVKRARALEEIQRKEAIERQKLAAAVVVAEQAGQARVANIAVKKQQEDLKRAAVTAAQLARAAQAKVKLEREQRQQQLAAAAAREREREVRQRKAQELKDQQRLYYAKRNAIHDAKFEMSSLNHFEAEMSELRPQTSAGSLKLGNSMPMLASSASTPSLNRPMSASAISSTTQLEFMLDPEPH